MGLRRDISSDDECEHVKITYSDGKNVSFPGNTNETKAAL
jgi:hypothetical protein